MIERTRPGHPRHRPRVAFQGELGAFSEEAVQQYFEGGAEAIPHREFRDVGRAVAAGEVDFGMLPIENTLAGSVVGSYDVLAEERVEVVGETVIPIHHFLLGTPDATLDGLARVISHPVALAQCARFLRSRAEVEPVAVYDTAGAAREVADRADPRTAAIAARGAAARYGLRILAAHVEDRPDNQTRFLLVRRPGTADPPGVGSGPSRTLLLVDTSNSPGALSRILLPFAERAINLTKLEARPTGEPWTYRFFLELELDLHRSVSGSAAVEEARRASDELRVLGCYRRAETTPAREADVQPATRERAGPADG